MAETERESVDVVNANSSDQQRIRLHISHCQSWRDLVRPPEAEMNTPHPPNPVPLCMNPITSRGRPHLCAEVNKVICLEGVRCMLGVGFGEGKKKEKEVCACVCGEGGSQSSHDPLLRAPPCVEVGGSVGGLFPAEHRWMLTNLQVMM